MRIALYLAKSGLGARRKTEELVRNGEVTVNGKTVTSFSFDVKDGDVVMYEGEAIQPKPAVYYLLNKPRGYTCSLEDEHAEKLIVELVPSEPPVWPVGRLDRETEGLILLTNDGDLTYKVTHPRFEKEKEYEVLLDKQLGQDELELLRVGVNLDDGFFRPDRISLADGRYNIVIHSGKKRLIRRLFKHFGREVVSLKRIRIGKIELGKLETGKWRKLDEQERKELDL
jgi:23S rRNA pseudouridine2605 synthase